MERLLGTIGEQATVRQLGQRIKEGQIVDQCVDFLRSVISCDTPSARSGCLPRPARPLALRRTATHVAALHNPVFGIKYRAPQTRNAIALPTLSVISRCTLAR